MPRDERLIKLYYELLATYGSQGWWPLTSCKGTNPTKSGSIKGYHPGDFSFPKNSSQQFEICIGAILTQNTAWPNVEKALINLKRLKCLSSSNLLKLPDKMLKEAIKPSGYYNQKARKLKEYALFYDSLKGKTPSREQLLSVWGIGNETADSILLYAYGKPFFVVDSYARRFLTKNKIRHGRDYDEVRQLFERSLPSDICIYQEFHALIVEDGKRF